MRSFLNYNGLNGVQQGADGVRGQALWSRIAPGTLKQSKENGIADLGELIWCT